MHRASSVIKADEKEIQPDFDLPIRNCLPPISIDGPFGHTTETLWETDVAILVAVGPSVMLCASVLKSIWYRINFAYEKTALRKVYFFWLCDNIEGLEWFKSLLSAIEGQNFDNAIEIHPVSPSIATKITKLMLSSVSPAAIRNSMERRVMQTKASLLACNHLRFLGSQTGRPLLYLSKS